MCPLQPDALAVASRATAVAFHGRIVRVFHHGRICLMRLVCDGVRFRVVARRDATEGYDEIAPKLTLGTLVRGEGAPQRSHDGEELLCKRIAIVSPNQLSEQETGLKQGSLFPLAKRKHFYHSYLCESETASSALLARSAILWELRRFLRERGYLECTTPVMGRTYYGGAAEPFVTHMRDGDRDMYLRVTSEIALKQIIGGSFNKVFEVGHSFRNGSVSARYLSPFYAAEIYTAMLPEAENIAFGLELVRALERAVGEACTGELVQGAPACARDACASARAPISFLHDIPVMTFEEYHERALGEPFAWDALATDNAAGGSACAEAYKRLKRELVANQVDPVVITDLPAGMSPLIHRKREAVLCRSYLVANRATVAEFAIGENDPKILRRELSRQQREQGDRYPRDYEAFLHAYEMGMPRIASVFIGIDRIIAALLGLDGIGEFQMSM